MCVILVGRYVEIVLNNVNVISMPYKLTSTLIITQLKLFDGIDRMCRYDNFILLLLLWKRKKKKKHSAELLKALQVPLFPRMSINSNIQLFAYLEKRSDQLKCIYKDLFHSFLLLLFHYLFFFCSYRVYRNLYY